MKKIYAGIQERIAAIFYLVFLKKTIEGGGKLQKRKNNIFLKKWFYRNDFCIQ